MGCSNSVEYHPIPTPTHTGIGHIRVICLRIFWATTSTASAYLQSEYIIYMHHLYIMYIYRHSIACNSNIFVFNIHVFTNATRLKQARNNKPQSKAKILVVKSDKLVKKMHRLKMYSVFP